MFLSRRATQAEYFDLPGRPSTEIAEGYRLLGRVNRLFKFAAPFESLLPAQLGEHQCGRLTVLDLGAGDGSLGMELQDWAARRGWHWTVTSLDLNPEALRLNTGGRSVAACALHLPFCDNAFDVAIAAQMTHHLKSEADVSRHFREAWRVARRAVIIYDLHRNLLLYGTIWALMHAGRFPPWFRSDGLLSVKRGWRVREWRALANRAGLPGARVWLEHGARITLQASKPGAAKSCV